MKAFHNDIKVKTKYVNRVVAHQKADRIVQGIPWENGKGCAVGCTLENYDHKQYEVELGIPEWLARLEDTLFEGMNKKDALKWPIQFLKAINIGVNLDKIKIPYSIYLIKENLKTLNSLKVNDKFIEVIEVINLTKNVSIQMIEALKSGNQNKITAAWSAESAARSAESAAESAAWSAAWSAARSAAWSASSARSAESAAYKKHSVKLLKLLKDCK